jgi:hypothetical protein
MATDGDVDYRSFTRAQLEEALSRIDPQRYPLNHARLLRELAARPPIATQAPIHKGGVSKPSSARLVITYTVTLTILSVFAGFIIGVSRRIAPGLIPKHVDGQFDAGLALWAVGALVVCFLVYRHLARRHRARYFRVGVPVAALVGLGNFASSALLSGSFPSLWFAVVAMGLYLGWLVAVGAMFGMSPNYALERTREG